MSADNLRIGIVGAGANTTARHIPGLQALDGVEIVSVCNRSRESSKRVADKFGIRRIYETWWELVAADDTDAVVIGTWPYLHAPITLAALEAEKHVLCEARMAMDAAEARRMLDAANARPHLVAQVVPSPFTLRVDNTIQRLISEGYLGDLLAIEVRVGGGFLDQESPLSWRQDTAKSGLNIMSLGIWYEALMRWVGEAVRVTAMAKTFVPMRQDAETGRMRAVSVPEHVNVIADMACGAQAGFMVSSVAGMAGAPEVYLFGSDATLRFSQNRLFGGRRGDDGLQELVVPGEHEGRWRVEEEFVNAIRGLEPVTHTTFRDGLKYMEFTEAVHRSMREGRSVPL
jgi:predicted dehydrogenase